MEELFDITKFYTYKENEQLEVKKAKNKLPNDMWETYSAFANTDGGIIILGAMELEDRSIKTSGMKEIDKDNILDNLWNLVHNKEKVSECLLIKKNVVTYKIEDDYIIVIYVPRAKREQRPVYINNDLFGGSYRRDNTGDYHCTKAQVKAMLRDQTDDSMDMLIINDIFLSDLNYETVHSYRNSHRSLRPGHPFERLTDEEYLVKIGAAAFSIDDNKVHPTAAGLLMFGFEDKIVRHFPEYFLDYRENFNLTTRWTDRIYSSSGDWSGNLFDFYYLVYNKIIKDIKVPFKILNGTRIDDTPIHNVIREALANCIVNADFYAVRGVVIKNEKDRLIFENPGNIRVGKEQMRIGGISDPRNKVLLKMFNFLDVGERAGSGVPNIFNVWDDKGFVEPNIIEEFNPDRTILVLEFNKKATEKSDRKKATEKSDRKKATEKIQHINLTEKTQNQINIILNYMIDDKWYKASEFINVLNLQETRTKEILRLMVELGLLESNNLTKGKMYRKKIIKHM